jgi:effector-binding domain-containing protein
MKKFVYVILGLLAVYLILCLAGPSSSKVERSAEINAPAEIVRTKMANLKFFHDMWSPWTEKDPGAKVTYSGEPGTEGSSMSWESEHKEVGKGTMTYKYTKGDTVMESLNFSGHESTVYYLVKSAGDSKSTVSWVLDGKTPFLMRAMMLFMNMDKMLGPTFEKGLSNLKTVMEAMPAETTATHYDVQELTWEAKTYYGKRSKLEFAKMAEYIGKTYGEIGEAMKKAKAEAIGAPKAIYFSFDETTMVADFAPVMEVANSTKLNGLEKFETPAGKVLLIDYYGPYDKSAQAHYAMDAYMKEKGLKQSVVVEEYITDPMTEKDPAKWLTKIYYVVK